MNVELKTRAARIKLLVLDVDGVLTDGSITYTSDGQEIKSFDIQDGLGLVIARRMGLHTAILSGRMSRAVGIRAKELDIEAICQNVSDKGEAIAELAARFDASLEETAFISDDLNDLPALAVVGLAIAVGTAAPEVKEVAHYVTERPGGKGAVREAVELILRAQVRWTAAVDRYRNP
jgi:3-deoxy-D-manno-octulosonate 8-phosphate phosphatase (KDO 8-P phosphatase)